MAWRFLSWSRFETFWCFLKWIKCSDSGCVVYCWATCGVFTSRFVLANPKVGLRESFKLIDQNLSFQSLCSLSWRSFDERMRQLHLWWVWCWCYASTSGGTVQRIQFNLNFQILPLIGGSFRRLEFHFQELTSEIQDALGRFLLAKAENGELLTKIRARKPIENVEALAHRLNGMHKDMMFGGSAHSRVLPVLGQHSPFWNTEVWKWKIFLSQASDLRVGLSFHLTFRDEFATSKGNSLFHEVLSIRLWDIHQFPQKSTSSQRLECFWQ